MSYQLKKTKEYKCKSEDSQSLMKVNVKPRTHLCLQHLILISQMLKWQSRPLWLLSGLEKIKQKMSFKCLAFSKDTKSCDLEKTGELSVIFFSVIIEKEKYLWIHLFMAIILVCCGEFCWK